MQWQPRLSLHFYDPRLAPANRGIPLFLIVIPHFGCIWIYPNKFGYQIWLLTESAHPQEPTNQNWQMQNCQANKGVKEGESQTGTAPTMKTVSRFLCLCDFYLNDNARKPASAPIVFFYEWKKETNLKLNGSQACARLPGTVTWMISPSGGSVLILLKGMQSPEGPAGIEQFILHEFPSALCFMVV